MKLEEAANKIRNRNQWTRGEMARNAFGFAVVAKSKNAVCWCAKGACEAVGVSIEEWDLLNSVAFSRYRTGGIRDPIVSVNDHIGHAETIDVFDTAIQILKLQEST